MGWYSLIKIVPLRINLYPEIFARILVEVDLTKPLTGRILVTMKEQKTNNEIEFFVEIDFENLPKLCGQCSVIGHGVLNCKSGAYMGDRLGYQEWRNGNQLKDEWQVPRSRSRLQSWK